MKSVLFRNILQFKILGFSLILLYACAEQENQLQQTQIEENSQPVIIDEIVSVEDQIEQYSRELDFLLR